MGSFDRPFEELMDLRVVEVKMHPFPHITKENFFAEDFYRSLKDSFPTCPPATGPTGYSLYVGDERFEELLHRSEAWKRLFQFVQSQAFVDYAAKQFGAVFRREGCRVDMSAPRFVRFDESRQQKEQRYLKGTGIDPQNVWSRLDIYQGKVGYRRAPHVDHRRRIVTALIYFCDRDEIEMRGGALDLLTRKRFSRKTRVEPRNNRLVMFPCCPGSWHSVPRIRRQKSPRNYIQLHLSSVEDAWPR